LTKVNAAGSAIPQGQRMEKGAALVGPKVNHMRGKKTALAVIVLLLIAGSVFNHYVPDYDVAADDEQTQVTDGGGTNVK
jgi:hypothetical protein